MRVSYRVCDICGKKLKDGCVIDVRYRSVKDGKNAQSQRCIDICDMCWNAIKNRMCWNAIKNRIDVVDSMKGEQK